ncbi:hypothetical protein YC2023_088763 [Brassica napus]
MIPELTQLTESWRDLLAATSNRKLHSDIDLPQSALFPPSSRRHARNQSCDHRNHHRFCLRSKRKLRHINNEALKQGVKDDIWVQSDIKDAPTEEGKKIHMYIDALEMNKGHNEDKSRRLRTS